jgi:hypothetical protein
MQAISMFTRVCTYQIQDVRARLIVLDHARLNSHTHDRRITVWVNLLRSNEGVGRIIVSGHNRVVIIII